MPSNCDVGEDSPESLDSKEIKPVNPKRNQPWIFIGRTDAEASILCHLMLRANSLEKTLMLGKIEGRRRRRQQDKMVGWHHWLNGHEFEQTLGDGEGQGKRADTIERLNKKIQYFEKRNFPIICIKNQSYSLQWKIKKNYPKCTCFYEILIQAFLTLKNSVPKHWYPYKWYPLRKVFRKQFHMPAVLPVIKVSWHSLKSAFWTSFYSTFKNSLNLFSHTFFFFFWFSVKVLCLSISFIMFNYYHKIEFSLKG